MDELVRWLTDCLDEDERIAVSGESWTAFDESAQGTRRVDVDYSIERVVACTRSWRGEHIAAWDPARVLREIEAKRQMVDRYEELRAASKEQRLIGDVTEEYQDFLLRLLALPYADRPGYQEAWRP